MASSSSSIFTGVKFSPILAPFNSGDSRRSRYLEDSRNKVRFNPTSPRLTPNRVRVEAQSLIPYNGLWYVLVFFFVLCLCRALNFEIEIFISKLTTYLLLFRISEIEIIATESCFFSDVEFS